MIKKEINKKIQNLNFFEISFLYFISVSFPPILFSLIGINTQNSYLLSILLLIILTVIVSIKLINLNKSTLIKEFKKRRFFYIVIFIVLIFGFIGKIVTLIPYNTPILHDPYSHAKWVKIIIDTGEISYFYSPLLHTLISVLHNIFGTTIPYLVVLVHALLAFSIPITFGYVSFRVSKKFFVGLIIFLVLSIITFPMNFFYTAGKNALVLGIAMLPYFIYSSVMFFKSERKILYSILLLLSIFTLFFSHYALFVSVAILFSILIGYVLIEELKKKDYRNTLILATIGLVAVITSVVWVYPRLDSNSKVETSSVTQNVVYKLPETTEILQSVKDTFNTFETSYLIFTLLILYSVLSTSFNKYEKVFFIISLILLIFHKPLGYLLYPDNLVIIAKTFVLIQSFMIVLISTYILTHIYLEINEEEKNKKLISFVLLAFSFVTMIFYIAIIPSRIEKFALIDNNDLSVFNQINRDLKDDECKSLISAVLTPTNNKIVSPVDGGMWLSVYTDCEAYPDFQYFNSEESHEFELIIRDILEDNIDDSDSIDQLKEKGVEYLYVDRGIFGRSINLGDLNEVEYEILYTSGDNHFIEFK